MPLEPSYFVVLSRTDDFDPQKLAGALSQILSMPHLDSITRLKHYWGMLHQTQEMNKAQELRYKLKQAGIETFVLHGSEMKKVPVPKILKKAVPGPGGLAFNEDGQDRLLPWSNFILACAGKIEESVTKKATLPPDGKDGRWVALTGLTLISAIAISAERSQKRQTTEQETRFGYYLDLIAKEGLDSVRISGNSFDYSYLNERKGYNTQLNFKNLVLDVAKFLPDVIRNQGMHSLETDAMMRGFKYNNVYDYEFEKLWLMQLASAGK